MNCWANRCRNKSGAGAILPDGSAREPTVTVASEKGKRLLISAITR